MRLSGKVQVLRQEPSPWLPVVISVLVLLLSGLFTYTQTDKALTARVSALEAHQESDSATINHIQQQVDRLVEWALGTR